MTAPIPTPSTPATENRLLEHQLALMCRFSPSALRGGVGAAAAIAWVVGTKDNLGSVLGWIGILIAVSVARSALQSHYLRNAAHLDSQQWQRFMLAGLAINGFVWSIPEIWLVPADPARQTVLGILAVGVAATAIASLSPVRHAYAALILPFMVPIGISYLWLDENFRVVAVGIVLFVIAMLRIAKRQYDAMSDLLRLQLDLQAQIEQRERTEAQLRDAKAEAEAANKAKSQFLANMSHELRTPLNGILGMSELLIRESTGKPLKHAQTVRNAGMRLLRIISDILDLARLEAGTLPMARSEFSPRSLTHDVIELLQEHAVKKGIEIQASIDAQVPEHAINDAGRIQQVLSNLVDNAIKFTERGAVQIKVSARALPSQEEVRALLRWEVRDAGNGIPPDAQARLFKPFSQLDESATRKFGGAGLGLAISRQIIEALGGSIGVESAAKRGSMFWFEVPVEAIETRERTRPAGLAALATPRGGRVLIVEDNPINRELAAEIVQAAGSKVATANDGEEALARLAHEQFDLVLMDWHMPVMDGLSATRRIRVTEQAQGRPRMPVIALTASVLPGDREACEAAGMDGFVAKPFTYDELIAVLDRWLPKKETAA